MTVEFNSNQLNAVYPYYSYAPETVRVVEETVEESFDENGKLINRIKKTVTRYEKQHSYGAQWISS